MTEQTSADTTEIRYPDVHVQLTGEDGNAFMVIGRMTRVLRREVGADAAAEFSKTALNSASYDDLLQLCLRTVNVD